MGTGLGRGLVMALVLAASACAYLCSYWASCKVVSGCLTRGTDLYSQQMQVWSGLPNQLSLSVHMP